MSLSLLCDASDGNKNSNWIKTQLVELYKTQFLKVIFNCVPLLSSKNSSDVKLHLISTYPLPPKKVSPISILCFCYVLLIPMTWTWEWPPTHAYFFPTLGMNPIFHNVPLLSFINCSDVRKLRATPFQPNEPPTKARANPSNRKGRASNTTLYSIN